jgi:transcription-repair coupling factor (superfamily II helicase)
MENRIQDALSQARSIGFYPPALRALTAAVMLRTSKAPILWIVGNTEEMYQAQEDLLCFLRSDQVEIFPAYDVRPYQDDSPSREILARRITTLHLLLRKTPAVVVVPLQAVLGFTLGKDDLFGSIVDLAVDRDISREDLSARLVQMGYTREALIDDVGQFSIRGSVMDIFSPGMDEPVRLDMFGDTITGMKHFDVRTQRSGKIIASARILPANEVLLDYPHMKNARARLRRIPEGNASFLIEDMEQGIYPPGIESYLPLFFEKPATVLDYVSRQSVLISPDKKDLGEMWDEVYGTFLHGYERAQTREKPCLAPDEVLMGREEILGLETRFSTWISTSMISSGDASPYRHLPFEAHPGKGSDTAFDSLVSMAHEGYDIFLFTQADMLSDRIEYGLAKRGIRTDIADGEFIIRHAGWGGRIRMVTGTLSSSFVLPELGVVVISAEEVFGARKKRKKALPGVPIYDPFTQLNVGDAVVHKDNGIGIFKGVVRLELDGTGSDYILLEYLGGDRLYVPVYRLALLQRYIGDVDNFTVDKLGGTRWAHAKNRARESVAKLAGELLELYARRQTAPGISYDTASPSIREFEDAFPYDETEDQLKAVEEAFSDMSSPRPMDRLICGDVGYGKTEVALRAAFVAVMSGRQVAVLVPTTLLARQHLITFRERMEQWPIRVEASSSMGTSAGNKEILQALEEGKVDIIIGTHGLISDRVKFKNLGLLVVDEEHRFGVRHKEMIKALRAEVDVLTLTATPIPRTLNMAISGLRDLSIIETPPAERKSIETMVTRFDDEAIQVAVTKELARGGQVFFVHNTVSTIDAMARHVQSICSQARVGVAHGQMPRAKLNQVMGRFLDRSITVLVTSAIISSGIDIPSANTIIINRADKFGLADLYQLRGRVGRSKVKGYALLLLPEVGKITRDAQKRLAAIKEYESLGAGFQMALRDMEIRGVGDILGSAQWGHVTAIGYELYQEMLKEAVDKLQGKEPVPEVDPEIRIGIDAFIPEDYCPDQHLRLGLYKRLFTASPDELNTIGDELKDLYGPMPAPVKTLLVISEIRDVMKRMRMRKLERSNDLLRLFMSHDSIVDLDSIIGMVQKRSGRLSPEGLVEIPLLSGDMLNEIRDILYAFLRDKEGTGATV